MRFHRDDEIYHLRHTLVFSDKNRSKLFEHKLRKYVFDALLVVQTSGKVNLEQNFT